MLVGEALAGVIIRTAAMGHHILGNWVNVTYASAEGEGELGFVVAPAGVEFGQWAADMVGTYASVLNGVLHIPHLAASMVELLLVMVS